MWQGLACLMNLGRVDTIEDREQIVPNLLGASTPPPIVDPTHAHCFHHGFGGTIVAVLDRSIELWSSSSDNLPTHSICAIPLIQLLKGPLFLQQSVENVAHGVNIELLTEQSIRVLFG